MDLNEAIIGRRAVRDYTSEAVDEQTIRRLIDACCAGAERCEPAAVDVHGGPRSGLT